MSSSMNSYHRIVGRGILPENRANHCNKPIQGRAPALISQGMVSDGYKSRCNVSGHKHILSGSCFSSAHIYLGTTIFS